MNIKYALLGASILLFVLPFYFPAYFWYLVFFFPVPLLYVAFTGELTFIDGFLWGLATFGLHLFGIGKALFLMHQQSLTHALPSILLVLAYLALWPGLWFWMCSYFSKGKSTPIKLCVWTFGMWAFVTFTNEAILWAFDKVEGYPFMHPLLPLAQHPKLLFLLPAFGMKTLTFLWVIVPASVAYFLLNPHSKNFFIALLTCIPWLVGYLQPQENSKKPKWLKTIAVVPITFNSSQNSNAIAQAIAYEIKKIHSLNPHIKTVILPESSIYQCNFVQEAALQSTWSQDALGTKINIIFGSFCSENSCVHNTVYWYKNGKQVGRHTKSHATIFAERLPRIAQYVGFKSLSVEHISGITPSTQKRPVFQLEDGISAHPYICSELFCSHQSDPSTEKNLILALCNDWWFTDGYLPRLMKYSAIIKAISWQQPILYLSYRHAKLIQIDGSAHSIELPE